MITLWVNDDDADIMIYTGAMGVVSEHEVLVVHVPWLKNGVG